MGMCKGCGQIFKTEDMIHNFCADCQQTENFAIESKLIESGEKEKIKLKDKKFFYTIIFALLVPIDIFLMYQENYHLVFIVSVLPLFGVFSYFEDMYYINKKLDKSENNITNKREIIIKALIVLSALWLLFLFPAPTYAIKKYISFGIIPVVLLLGLIWIYLTYSKNKKS